MNRHQFYALSATIILLGLGSAASSQVSGPKQTSAPAVATTASGVSPSVATTNAEREKIWNSPTMLRARAWVQEYCKASKKITPAEADDYMKELENLTPKQMKLWLLKFDHEEEMIRQQQDDFNRMRQASVGQAQSVDHSADQEYADINRGENEAAEMEGRSIRAQEQQAASRYDDKQQDTAIDAAGATSVFGGFGGLTYGGYPNAGMYPWAPYHPQIHIHVHNNGD